jgi:ligand-binding sensor domain-containing protein
MTRKPVIRPLLIFIASISILMILGIKNAIPLINPVKFTDYPGTSQQIYSDSLIWDGELSITNVNAIVVDEDNIKWFCTEDGIVSHDGKNWMLYNKIKDIPNQDLKGITFAMGPEGPGLWIASPAGATNIRFPIEEKAEIITMDPENSDILSKDVVGIAAGKNSIRWIGTLKGISALLSQDKWLTPDYEIHYPEDMFQDWPITSMATNPEGDTLFAGTAGAGVVRVYRDELDAISGASVYAQWGPIILPSDNILSVYIAPDGTQWFGTDQGIAKHTGNITLDNWKVYTTEDGLVDDYVQSICGDDKSNIWFGTRGGLSVYNGSSWTTYTVKDGLVSENILCLAFDYDGVLWIGSDKGITSFEKGEIVNYGFKGIDDIPRRDVIYSFKGSHLSFQIRLFQYVMQHSIIRVCFIYGLFTLYKNGIGIFKCLIL